MWGWPFQNDIRRSKNWDMISSPYLAISIHLLAIHIICKVCKFPHIVPPLTWYVLQGFATLGDYCCRIQSQLMLNTQHLSWVCKSWWLPRALNSGRTRWRTCRDGFSRLGLDFVPIRAVAHTGFWFDFCRLDKSFICNVCIHISGTRSTLGWPFPGSGA